MARLVVAVASAMLTLMPATALPATAVVKPFAPVVAPPAPTAAAAPPYESELLRLSEILGAVHYLRQLCGSGEGDAWREQMQKLIETEAPDEARRARMVDRFNRGYDSYQTVYLSCTPAASEATTRYLTEGAKIAAEITARYGK